VDFGSLICCRDCHSSGDWFGRARYIDIDAIVLQDALHRKSRNLPVDFDLAAVDLYLRMAQIRCLLYLSVCMIKAVLGAN
jgi:hypothetical protein